MKLVCIGCPMGCALDVKMVDDKIVVSGNRCNKGKDYATNEFVHPVRILTTTVKITGGLHDRLPVYSAKPIDKEDLKHVSLALKDVCVSSPVHYKDIVCTIDGIDFLASRDM